MVGTSASRRVPAGICQLAEFDEIPVKRPPCLVKNAVIQNTKKKKRREDGVQDDQRNDVDEQLRASKQPDLLEVRQDETRVLEGNEEIKKKKKAKKQKNVVDQANNNTVAEEPAQLSRRLSRRQSIVDPTFSPKISPVMATRLDTLFYGDDDSEHCDDKKKASASSTSDNRKKQATGNTKH